MVSLSRPRLLKASGIRSPADTRRHCLGQDQQLSVAIRVIVEIEEANVKPRRIAGMDMATALSSLSMWTAKKKRRRNFENGGQCLLHLGEVTHFRLLSSSELHQPVPNPYSPVHVHQVTWLASTVRRAAFSCSR